MRNFGKPRHVGVDIQAHGGFRVTESAGELDSLNAGLMPQGSPAVAKAVGTETGEAHSGANPVPVDAEWEAFLERGDKKSWGVDDAAVPLPLGALTFETHLSGFYIARCQGENFTHAHTKLFHRDDRKFVGQLETFENGDDILLVGWYRFGPYHAWKLDAPVARDVHDTSEVQHHAQLADEQPHRAGLVFCGEYTDPGDCLAYCDLVDGPTAECFKDHRLTKAVAVEGASGDVTSAGEPLRVDTTEPFTTDDGSTQFRLRVFRSGKPVAYEIAAYHCFPPGSKRPTVLHLRIPAAAPVADVEPAAVPGVPRTNVEGRHQ